ncbi:hypothetical protein ACQP10_38150 (plasmid) [Streptosporangium sandarakinum]|uniref:hypothetical protein n=1 Tax=Streptosporangium sandarakinum TaxID=1260955 RepID=UPI003D9279D3
MAGNSAGNLRPLDLAGLVRALEARVKALELQASVRPVFFITDATSTSSTTFTRMAWSSFPRSGSSVTVDVSVSGGTGCELQLRADGTQIAAATVTSSGTVTLQGFLAEGWAFGARKVVEVQAKVSSGTATIAVVGAWHR